jgi:hypothetical protein
VFYESHIFKAVVQPDWLRCITSRATEALDYSPSNQQFAPAKQLTIRACNYSVVDAFISADIKSVSVTLKPLIIRAALRRHYATPYYSPSAAFSIEIKWNFFN